MKINKFPHRLNVRCSVSQEQKSNGANTRPQTQICLSNEARRCLTSVPDRPDVKSLC